MHVLITGANRGIGAALVQSYEARGDTVSAVSRDAAPGLRLDVTSQADHAALADNLQGRSIDLLVCNAGCLLYTSPSPRDLSTSRMPSSA